MTKILPLKKRETVDLCYSQGILISAQILISAADFGGKKMHIGIKI
jgi:hypothetical protein